MLNSPPQIAANTSVYVTPGSSNTTTAIPTKEDGSAARYVLVSSPGYMSIAFGPSGVVAVVADSLLITPYAYLIINVSGQTHFGAIEITASGSVCITPLENQ